MEHPAIRTAGDTVLAMVDRERLGGVLAAVHRAGLGSLARVFDPRRGPIAAQLRRAGLPEPPEAATADPALVMLALTVPGRAAIAADALARGGAHRVYVTARGATAEANLLRTDAAADPDPESGSPTA